MTDFNKGDIIYPTAEYQEQVRVAVEEEGAQDYRDEQIMSGAPLRVVGKTTPIPSPLPFLPDFPLFLAAVPVDSERTDFSEEDFLAGDPADFTDVYLLMVEEVEHDGGVLAGV